MLMKPLNTDSYVETYSGKKIYLDSPKPEDFVIEDIVQGLAHTCRFGGQIRTFYSVAQHSLILSGLVPEKYCLTALLHDSSEAYLCDIPTPIKALLPRYRVMEDRFMRAIAKKFNIIYPFPDFLVEMDRRLLLIEAAHFELNVKEWAEYNPLDPPTELEINVMPMDIALQEYKFRLKELAGEM